MIDFLPEQVRTLNELETATFNFILSNLSSIDKMSVRQLAQAVHVSTATVMRMTRKLGFEGWLELKYYLKNQNQLTEIPVNYYENLLQLDLFLRTSSGNIDKRYGAVYVDPKSHKRIPKKSFHWFKNVFASNGDHLD